MTKWFARSTLAALVVGMFAWSVHAEDLGYGAWGLTETGLTGAASAHFNDDVIASFGNTAAAPDAWIEWDTTGTDALDINLTDCDGAGADCVPLYWNTGTDDAVMSGNLSLDGGYFYTDKDDTDTYIRSSTADTMQIAVGNGTISITESTDDSINFGSFSFVRTSYVIPTTVTVTANAATIDWSNGDAQILDLQGSSAAVTVTLSTPLTGGSYFIKVIQGDNGDTITWPAAVKWTGGTAPTITAAEDSVDSVACLYDGTIYMCSWIGDYQ